MSGDHLFGVAGVVGDDRVERLRRPAYVGGLSLSIAGMILGAAYGGAIEPASLFAAVLLGGLFARRANLAHGGELYANLFLSILVGSALGSIAISGVFSVMLGFPVMNVVFSTAPKILAAATAIATMGLVGFVGGLAVTFLGLSIRDSVGLVLLIAGGLAFLAIQYRMGAIRPDAGPLTTPVLSEGTESAYRFYRYAGFLAGGAAFLGFASLLRTRRRYRVAAAVLVVVGVAFGAFGVGRVGAQIDTLRTTSSISDRVSIQVTDMEVTDENLELSVRIRNPSQRTLRITGVYARASNDSDVRIAYGAGQRVDDGPATLAPGEAIEATYRVGLTPPQSDRLRAALESGEVAVSGRITFHLSGGSVLPADIDTGFDVTFRCVLGDGEIRCRST